MKEKIFFMKQALKEAEKAYRKGEVPIGAVIVKDGKIISRGYNLKETKKNTLKHAEIIAIEKASIGSGVSRTAITQDGRSDVSGFTE